LADVGRVVARLHRAAHPSPREARRFRCALAAGVERSFSLRPGRNSRYGRAAFTRQSGSRRRTEDQFSAGQDGNSV
jgi:hypothetical protein